MVQTNLPNQVMQLDAKKKLKLIQSWCSSQSQLLAYASHSHHSQPCSSRLLKPQSAVIPHSKLQKQHENYVRFNKTENLLGRQPSSSLPIGHQVPQNPVLDNVLFDQCIIRIWQKFKAFGQMGLWGFMVRVATKPGIGLKSPILVLEAIVEGTGEVCQEDMDGILGRVKGILVN